MIELRIGDERNYVIRGECAHLGSALLHPGALVKCCGRLRADLDIALLASVIAIRVVFHARVQVLITYWWGSTAKYVTTSCRRHLCLYTLRGRGRGSGASLPILNKYTTCNMSFYTTNISTANQCCVALCSERV
eukprot:5810405-Pleurochrysis_carterae.AAC.1